MIFLNLKTYPQATGEKAVELLFSVKKIIEESKIKIIPIVQATDIYRIKKSLGIEVWSQHVDSIDPGRGTGFISAYALKEAGASGVLLNHSEHKIERDIISSTIKKAKNYGLKILLVGHTPAMVLDFDNLTVDFLAYERQDLIEGEISLIDQQKETIKTLIKKLKHPLIIGAGIKNEDDIKKTIAVGGRGVLLASHFVKAKNPKEKLKELVSAFFKK